MTLLDRLLGADGDPVLVEVGVTTWPADSVGPIRIRHGRADFLDNFDPATCTFSLDAEAADSPPELGDHVRVALGPAWFDLLDAEDPDWPASLAERFTGSVTDVRAVLGVGSPTGYVYAVTAVSPRAALGSVFIGDEPWPAESATTRAARILGLVTDQLPSLFWEVEPPNVGAQDDPTVLARDVDRQPALALLTELAEDTRATLSERRDGTLVWKPANRWGTFVPRAILDTGQILRPVSWSKSPAGILTDVSVEYGTATPRATATTVVTGPVTSAASIASQLSTLAGAQALCADLIAHRSKPWWRLEEVGTDLLRHTVTAGVTPAQAMDLLDLESTSLLAVDGLPTAGPFAARRLWVEGWTETITAKSWGMAFDVTDYRTRATTPTWDEVGDATHPITWDDLEARAPTVSWDDLDQPWLEI